MFEYSLIINLFLKKGIKKYVENNSITVGDIIVIISCLNNFHKYNNILLCAIGYLYKVTPLHIYLYLYYNLPKLNRVPYSKKIRKFKPELCAEYEALGKVFGWSKRETFRNRLLLDIIYTKKELKKEMGIK